VKQNLNSKIAFSVFLTLLVEPSWSYPRRCLEQGSRSAGSELVSSGCRILQAPLLIKKLFTFPYLGTRSYEVEMWEGKVLHFSITRHYEASFVVNRCSGETLQNVITSSDYSSSSIEELVNQNTSEFIRSIAELTPASRAEVMKQWKRMSQGCN